MGWDSRGSGAAPRMPGGENTLPQWVHFKRTPALPSASVGTR
jgi:hypothetical protein